MIISGKERDYVVHDEDNIKGFFGKYRFLSNFTVGYITFEGIEYPSTENAYQAAKTLDLEKRKEFINVTPSQAKKLGRDLKVRDDWDIVKFEVMLSVCREKFKNHSDLREALLATEDRYLEETNHWKDIYWGVCNGEGENNLGKVLMQIRKELKDNGQA